MSHTNNHDFFKKMGQLFEGKESADDKLPDPPKEINLTPAQMGEKKTGSKKPVNVKETASEFFRKYSDLITEAESAADREDDDDDTNADEEDDDLETKGEGDTKKNLPPWLNNKKSEAKKK